MPADPTPARSNSDEALLALILEAFEMARRGGKTDWHRMYAGPLKNRILILCGGKLDEAEWESTPFTKLLARFPDALAVDFAHTPPMVELLSAGRIEAATAGPDVDEVKSPDDVSPVHLEEEDARRWRIRNDLWDAVMAIRTSDVFVWRDGAAIRVPADDSEADAEALQLPTLTGAELDGWQAAFAEELAGDDQYASLLELWGRGARPTSSLPRHLQHLWYSRLKTLVRARIESWFEATGIPLPHDVVQIPTDYQRSGGRGATSLRVFVERCVAVMTEGELAELRFPAAVPMRLQR